MSQQAQSFQRQSEGRKFGGEDAELLGVAPGSEVEDLIHSWRRITDPRHRQIALGVIRAMAT